MSDSISTQLGAYAGYISLGLAIVGMIVGAVNHKRVVSTCCRREASFSIDIDSTALAAAANDAKAAKEATTPASGTP